MCSASDAVQPRPLLLRTRAAWEDGAIRGVSPRSPTCSPRASGRGCKCRGCRKGTRRVSRRSLSLDGQNLHFPCPPPYRSSEQEGWTPLHAAVAGRCATVVSLLLTSALVDVNVNTVRTSSCLKASLLALPHDIMCTLLTHALSASVACTERRSCPAGVFASAGSWEFTGKRHQRNVSSSTAFPRLIWSEISR